MRFLLKIQRKDGTQLPINYQYPLSAAIYKILAKGDKDYAAFLHEKGYGKGFKFFTFSDLKLKYERVEDRLVLKDDLVELTVAFHLPQASQSFIEGLFKSEEIVIADKKSKVRFRVQSIIAMDNPLCTYEERAIIQVTTRPMSAIVAGVKNEAGNYEYLMPDHKDFTNSLLSSWQNKIKEAYEEAADPNPILNIVIVPYKNPFRTRLIHIKDGQENGTKIRGSLNYKLLLTAERRYIDLIMNAGLGLYSAQGMGCVEVVEE